MLTEVAYSDISMEKDPSAHLWRAPSPNSALADQAIASIGARHGSLGATSMSSTLVSIPHSIRSDSGRSRASQYDNIVRKYREIMDAFHNEIREVATMGDDNPRISVVSRDG